MESKYMSVSAPVLRLFLLKTLYKVTLDLFQNYLIQCLQDGWTVEEVC